jgi:hypothetical protein
VIIFLSTRLTEILGAGADTGLNALCWRLRRGYFSLRASDTSFKVLHVFSCSSQMKSNTSVSSSAHHRKDLFARLISEGFINLVFCPQQKHHRRSKQRRNKYFDIPGSSDGETFGEC